MLSLSSAEIADMFFRNLERRYLWGYPILIPLICADSISFNHNLLKLEARTVLGIKKCFEANRHVGISHFYLSLWRQPVVEDLHNWAWGNPNGWWEQCCLLSHNGVVGHPPPLFEQYIKNRSPWDPFFQLVFLSTCFNPSVMKWVTVPVDWSVRPHPFVQCFSKSKASRL